MGNTSLNFDKSDLFAVNFFNTLIKNWKECNCDKIPENSFLYKYYYSVLKKKGKENPTLSDIKAKVNNFKYDCQHKRSSITLEMVICYCDVEKRSLNEFFDEGSIDVNYIDNIINYIEKKKIKCVFPILQNKDYGLALWLDTTKGDTIYIVSGFDIVIQEGIVDDPHDNYDDAKLVYDAQISDIKDWLKESNFNRVNECINNSPLARFGSFLNFREKKETDIRLNSVNDLLDNAKNR